MPKPVLDIGSNRIYLTTGDMVVINKNTMHNLSLNFSKKNKPQATSHKLGWARPIMYKGSRKIIVDKGSGIL